MDCFSFADKMVALVFGFLSSVLLTTLYFTLLFAIRIDIKQRKEHIRGRQTRNRDD